MTFNWAKNFLSPYSTQLPHLLLRLKGFLRGHGTHQGPLTRLVCCFQSYRETSLHRRVWKSQDTVKNKQLTQILNERILKTHFFTLILDCEKSTE